MITGEGRLDGQSFQGKVAGEVLSLAERYGKPVFALCGTTGDDLTDGQRGRFAGISALTDHALDVQAAMTNPELFVSKALRSMVVFQ